MAVLFFFSSPGILKLFFLLGFFFCWVHYEEIYGVIISCTSYHISSKTYTCRSVLLIYDLWWLGSLRKLDEQPEWLKGGKLRDYQLEGLNFLVNRYTLKYIWNMHSVNSSSESLFILMWQLEKWYKCCFSWWNGSW